MADVFISYSKKDISLAKTLAEALVRHGFTVWYDADLSSGDDFREEIARELDSAISILVIWTVNSAASDWVISEAQRAHRLGKLVPVRSSDFPFEAIPQPFDILHSIVADDQAEIVKAVAKKLKNYKILTADEHGLADRAHAVSVDPGSTRAEPLSSRLTRPQRCFGRNQDLELLLAALLRKDCGPEPRGFFARFLRKVVPQPRVGVAPRIIVFGGPGIGKTTLTREAACHAEVEAAFGDRRLFVSLEGKETPDTFREAIGQTLNISPDLSGRFPALTEMFAKLPKEPTLFILDNLETPLEDHRHDIENELRAFDAYPYIAVMASLRGRELPAAPSWTVRHEINPLDGETSTALFLDIAPSIAKTDPCLEPFIQALGGVPLTIELVANEAAAFNSLEAVWSEWRRIGTAMARRFGTPAARLSSFDYSLELSLNSSRRLPKSLILLALIASLQGGADISLCERVFGSQYFAIVRDLLGAGLIYQRGYRVDTLPPIREYAVRRLTFEHEQWRAVLEYFLEKAEWFSANGSPSDSDNVKRFLLADQVNLVQWLGSALNIIPATRLYDLVKNLVIFLNGLAPQEGSVATIIRLHRLTEDFFSYHVLMAFKRRYFVVGCAYCCCQILATDTVADTLLQNIAQTIDEAAAISKEMSFFSRKKLRSFVKDMRHQIAEISEIRDNPSHPKNVSFSREYDERLRLNIHGIDADNFRIVSATAPPDSESFESEGAVVMFWAMAQPRDDSTGDLYAENLRTGFDSASWPDDLTRTACIMEHVTISHDYLSKSKSNDLAMILDIAASLHYDTNLEADVREEAKCWIETAASLNDRSASILLASLPMRIELARAEAARDHKGAFQLRHELIASVEQREALEGGEPGEKTASYLGRLAWEGLLTGNYAAALAASERAEKLAPRERWHTSNKAHALMFLGFAQEARALYLRHRGRAVGDDSRLWEDAVRDDFASLRAEGIMHPQMIEVEALLGGPLQSEVRRLPQEESISTYAVKVLALKREIGRAVGLLVAGAKEEAQEQLVAASRRHPSGASFIAQAFVARGELWLDNETDLKSDAKARELFTEAASWSRRSRIDRPLLACALLGLGRAQFNLRDYSAAIAAFHEANELGTADAEPWLWWAKIHLGSQQADAGTFVEGILTTWTSLINSTPSIRNAIAPWDLKTNMAIWSGIAQLHAQLRAADRAEKCTRCDSLASYVYDPYRLAPSIAFEAIDTDAAIAACTEALASQPEEIRLHYLRARAHRRAGATAQAAGDRDTATVRFAAAITDCRAAMAAGYPAAFTTMAAMLEAGQGVAIDLETSANLYAETCNRVIHVCAVPVARHLLAEERKHDTGEVRRVVAAILGWSAALGNDEAGVLLADLIEQRVLAFQPVAKASFGELMPWLRPGADFSAPASSLF